MKDWADVPLYRYKYNKPTPRPMKKKILAEPEVHPSKDRPVGGVSEYHQVKRRKKFLIPDEKGVPVEEGMSEAMSMPGASVSRVSARSHASNQSGLSNVQPSRSWKRNELNLGIFDYETARDAPSTDYLYAFQPRRIMSSLLESFSEDESILNPTTQELQQVQKRLQKEHPNIVELLSQLYEGIVVQRMPINTFLSPFWTPERDNELMAMYVDNLEVWQVSGMFNEERMQGQQPVTPQRVNVRLGKLLMRAVGNYNLEVEEFRDELEGAKKIGEADMNRLIEEDSSKADTCRKALLINLMRHKVTFDDLREVRDKVEVFLKYR